MKVKSIPCWECFGTGLLRPFAEAGLADEPCKVCNGEGEYLMTDRSNQPTLEQQINPDEQDKL